MKCTLKMSMFIACCLDVDVLSKNRYRAFERSLLQLRRRRRVRDELALVFQVRSFGRTIRYSARARQAELTVTWNASLDSNIWITSRVGTSAPSAPSRIDGSIISWSTSRPHAVRRKRSAVPTAVIKAIASGT